MSARAVVGLALGLSCGGCDCQGRETAHADSAARAEASASASASATATASASATAGAAPPPREDRGEACGVYAHGGNVYARPPCPAGGPETRLTDSRRDVEAVESRDHRMIAFVRAGSDDEPLAIWTMTREGGHARKALDTAKTPILFPATAEPESQQPVSAFSNLTFSPDRKRLYFMTDGWATSRALYALDLDTGKAELFDGANGYFVIDECKKESFVGHLVLLQHRYPSFMVGTLDWYYLFTKDGREVGAMGPEWENVERFLAKRCGVGHAPEEPPPHEVPVALASTPLVACGMHIDRKRTQFLDGTTLDLYLARDASSPTDIPIAHDADGALELLDRCRE